MRVTTFILFDPIDLLGTTVKILFFDVLLSALVLIKLGKMAIIDLVFRV